jgi:hypothetical protein
MDKLSEEKCVVCRENASGLSVSEIAELKSQLAQTGFHFPFFLMRLSFDIFSRKTNIRFLAIFSLGERSLVMSGGIDDAYA